MSRVTWGGVAVVLLAVLGGCAKQEEPQPKLTQQAHPDRKFEIESINNAPGGAGLPAKAK